MSIGIRLNTGSKDAMVVTATTPVEILCGMETDNEFVRSLWSACLTSSSRHLHALASDSIIGFFVGTIYLFLY